MMEGAEGGGTGGAIGQLVEAQVPAGVIPLERGRGPRPWRAKNNWANLVNLAGPGAGEGGQPHSGRPNQRETCALSAPQAPASRAGGGRPPVELTSASLSWLARTH